MKRTLPALLLAAFIMGCQPKTPSNPPDAPTNGAATPSQAGEVTGGQNISAGELKLNIGDVEAQVFIAANIAEESRGLQVAVKEIITPSAKKMLGMCIVTVTAPFPKTLWAEFSIKSFQAFPDQPVAMRGVVLRGEETIGKFHTVLGKYAQVPGPVEGMNVPELVFKLDLLEGLAEIPETLAVYAQFEALLMPLGTGAETLDPLAAAIEEVPSATIRSNPIRIKFISQ